MDGCSVTSAGRKTTRNQQEEVSTLSGDCQMRRTPEAASGHLNPAIKQGMGLVA
jgi:hypothetical protein